MVAALLRPALLLSVLAALVACSGTHKQPTGPAPEYEDAPPPSWWKDGGAQTAPAPAEALPIPAAAPAPDGGNS